MYVAAIYCICTASCIIHIVIMYMHMHQSTQVPATKGAPPLVGPSLITATHPPLTIAHPPHITSITPNTLNPLQRGVREGEGGDSVKKDERRLGVDGGKTEKEGVGREGRKGKGGNGRAEGGQGLKSKRGDLLGTVELSGNLNISTQFEEEQEQDSSSVSQLDSLLLNTKLFCLYLHT